MKRGAEYLRRLGLLLTVMATIRKREGLGLGEREETRPGNGAARRVAASRECECECKRSKNAVSPPHNLVPAIFFSSESHEKETARKSELPLLFSFSVFCF